MKSLLLLIATAVLASAQPPSELRGVWITNVDSDVLTSDAKIAQAMNHLAAVGVNVVFPVVWNAGYTLYPSSVMKGLIGTEIFPGTAYQNRDPLQRLIIEAHRNGIEVIPWFEYGLAAKYATSAASVGEILTARPSWAARNSDGKLTTNVYGGGLPSFVWMNGINPEVQDFMLSLITEVTDRYDVDGIQGDDRLPALPVDGGYDSATVALYRSEHFGGDPPVQYADAEWMRWRADKLNRLMMRIRDSVKVRSPHLIVSTGPSEYAWGYGRLLQDSKTWVDSGLVDNFIPQLYPDDGDRQTPSAATNAYIFRLDRALGVVPAAKKGIFFGGVLAKVGPYVADPATLIGNVSANRARGIMGETYFFYEGIANANKKNGDSLRATVYKKDALLPYRNGTVWRPKAAVVNENDPGAVTAGQWVQNIAPGFTGGILVARDTGFARIDYRFSVPVSAHYDVYAFIGASPSVYTTKALYRLRSGNDSLPVTFDQSKAAASTWQKLGTVYVEQGLRTVVTLTNEGIESNRMIMTDAVMLMLNRRLSPEVVVPMGVTGREPDAPAGFRLRQNYPNPFNPSTSIRYDLERTSAVRLTVTDILGRPVARLVDRVQGPGSHSAEWSAASTSSGVYLCRLEVDGSSVTRKMVLVK